MEEEKIEYKVCSTCKAKIGYFRKRVARKQDASGKYPIIQEQFCSSKCSKIGYQIFLEFGDVKKAEQIRLLHLIENAQMMITRARTNILRKYGSVENVPLRELPLLHSGAYSLLENMKEKLKNEQAQSSKA